MDPLHATCSGAHLFHMELCCTFKQKQKQKQKKKKKRKTEQRNNKTNKNSTLLSILPIITIHIRIRAQTELALNQRRLVAMFFMPIDFFNKWTVNPARV